MEGEGAAGFQRVGRAAPAPRATGALPRFADLPLLVKIGIAPAFAMVMLVLALGCALWSQQRQLAVLNAVLAEDNARNQLEISAKAISTANGAFYHCLGWQANGGTPGAVQAGLQDVLAQLDTARQNLRGVQRFVPPSERADYVQALQELDDYRGAISRLAAVTDDNFGSAGRYVVPYELERERAAAQLDELAMAMNAQARALAVQSRDVARRIAIIAVAGVLLTLLLVVAVVWLVFAAIRQTVGEICHATESLAAGRLDIDLYPLRRSDEFGAIVRSLEVFEENQRRLTMLRAEKKIMEKRQKEVRALADLDELTGLLNRRAMVPLVRRQVQVRQERAEDAQPTCLAMIDLDYFKAVNDDYGHLAGDEALRIVAHACVDALRCGDVLARWGGEEFLLMLPNTGLQTAALCLERLRALLAYTPFDSIEPGLSLTISAGVAEIVPGDTIEAAIARADQALYAAKRGGRNQVVLAGAEPVSAA
jgi:diguanylate cyclase (GGDEF)-like protein